MQPIRGLGWTLLLLYVIFCKRYKTNHGICFSRGSYNAHVFDSQYHFSVVEKRNVEFFLQCFRIIPCVRISFDFIHKSSRFKVLNVSFHCVIFLFHRRTHLFYCVASKTNRRLFVTILQ